MSHQFVIDLSRDAILTALLVAAPLLLIALGVGLVISIIQSVTQIQEQTLSFVPKLVLVGGAFIVTNNENLVAFAVSMLQIVNGSLLLENNIELTSINVTCSCMWLER